MNLKAGTDFGMPFFFLLLLIVPVSSPCRSVGPLHRHAIAATGESLGCGIHGHIPQISMQIDLSHPIIDRTAQIDPKFKSKKKR